METDRAAPGEDRQSFGIDVRRRLITLRISMLALAVAFVGPIVALSAWWRRTRPHDLRRRSPFLPAGQCADWRAGVVDGLGGVENLVPGVIIPVGIVTSLVGVPFFLSILAYTGGTCEPGLHDRNFGGLPETLW